MFESDRGKRGEEPTARSEVNLWSSSAEIHLLALNRFAPESKIW